MEAVYTSNLSVTQYILSADFTYFGLMELLLDGGEAASVDVNTGNNALHLLYSCTLKPAELLLITKLLVENGCQMEQKNKRDVTPIELLVLHINRGLMYHKPRLSELRRMEDLNIKQSDIDQASAEFDAEYQKQVCQCVQYFLSKSVNCDIVAAEVPSIPHDKTWSEAFEHKLVQQEGRWTLLKFGTGMIYSKYNIFNPLTKNRVKNTYGLSLIHLVAWRGEYLCLKEVLHHCKEPAVTSNDGRNALHLLYHYCNRPMDIVACTKLLLNAGVNPNQADQNGNTPLFLLLKHTFVKKSYIKYLANSYEKTVLDIDVSSDWMVDEVIECMNLLLDSGINIHYVDHNGSTALHAVFLQLTQVLYNCDIGFQEMGHSMVPYRFNIKPATQVISVLLKTKCRVNTQNKDGDTALHLLCKCMENMCLRARVNSVQDIIACFSKLISYGADLSMKNKQGTAAIHFLPIQPDIIRSSSGTILDYVLPIINLFASNGANMNTADGSNRTLLHRFLSLRYGGGTGFLNWNRFRFLQGLLAFNYQNLIELLISHGADPSVPFVFGDKVNYLLNSLYSAHNCDVKEPNYNACCNVDALSAMLQLLTHNMTQASVQSAMCIYFTCCQTLPNNSELLQGLNVNNYTSYESVQNPITVIFKHHATCSRLQPNEDVDATSCESVFSHQDSLSEKHFTLHKQSLNCDICEMLMLTVSQPRCLKHICRLSIWRALDNRFVWKHKNLPLPPALKDYIGDFKSS